MFVAERFCFIICNNKITIISNMYIGFSYLMLVIFLLHISFISLPNSL